MQQKKWIPIVITLLILAGAGSAYWFGVYKPKMSKVVPQTPQPQTGTTNKTTVNAYGLKGVTTVGMIKMFNDKTSIGDKYDVNYQVVENPDILMSKITTGTADFAALPTNIAANIYNKGMDYKLAAITSWGVLYVLSSDTATNSIQDLKGKTVYVADKGATTDVMLRYLLSKNNINPDKDLKLDYSMEHVSLSQAMIADRASIGILPEPFVTMVKKQNTKFKTLVNVQDEWKKIQGATTPFAQTCLIVKGSFAKNNPQAVSTFLDQYKTSINWVNDNPAQAGTLVEKFNIGMKADVAQAAIPNLNLRYEDAQSAKTAINALLKVIYDFSPKDIGGKLPDEGFFYKR